MLNLFNQPKSHFMITKRKFYYAIGFTVFLVVYFSVRSKYFERSDFLRPVTRTIKNASGKISDKIFKNSKDIVGDILNNKIEEGYDRNFLRKRVEKTMKPWDKWMSQNPDLQSIGDIYDKCDNRTRKTIGKVVLEQDKGDVKGVKLLMLLNMTFDHHISEGVAHMLVKYKGMVMHDYEYDLCEEVADLENPLSCPFKKGYELRLRNYVKLPSYIPKGHYVVRSRVKDQDGKEFGCIEAEVMTGQQKT